MKKEICDKCKKKTEEWLLELNLNERITIWCRECYLKEENERKENICI